MKNKRFQRVTGLVIAFVLAISACIMPAFADQTQQFTPGEYTAKARGFGGEISLTVTVDDNNVLAVSIVGDDETAQIGSNAVDQLPAMLVAANGNACDVVSGATITSTAVFEAYELALKQARGEAVEPIALAFTQGTFTGTARGYNGDVVLNVTFSADAITGIELVESRETAHVGTPAFDILFALIQEFGSTGIDVVSGATFTSNAILTAVEDAGVQAGADVQALRTGAKPFAFTPGERIIDTYDIVVVGAGGAGMAAAASAAQSGATVLVIEKEAEIGGNTLVAGGPFQASQLSAVWDPANPEAIEAAYEVTGETVTKAKMDAGRLATLQMILDWNEQLFDETIVDAGAIHSVDDYHLAERGVHPEFLPTLQTLKEQIRQYMAYADEKMQAGAKETDLTLFSTVELHIFQTYYGGLRLNHAKDKWIVNNFDLVKQMCESANDIKPWYIAQGATFDNSQGTLIGSMWQRTIRMLGGTVDGVEYDNKWGAYFKVPENTLLAANEKNKIMTRTTAKELMTDGNRVTGVKAVEFDGTEVEITAVKGVILATGGYGANIQMVVDTNEYWDTDDLTTAIKTTNRNLAQGEGIVMAQAVGADVVGMGWTQLMPLGWVDNGNLAGGTGETVIYISPSTHPNAGRRYVDEAAERDVLSQGAFDFGTEDGVYVELSNPGDVTSSGNIANVANVEGRSYICTLDEASELLNIERSILEQTITEYDAFIIGKTDVPPVPAKSGYRGTIGSCEQNEDGTYNIDTYKVEVIRVRFMAPSTHHTMGGLVVDTQRQVLTADGSVIPGLYAAGEVTGGFFAGNRLGANAILEILVSGKIAGETAANN